MWRTLKTKPKKPGYYQVEHKTPYCNATRMELYFDGEVWKNSPTDKKPCKKTNVMWQDEPSLVNSDYEKLQKGECPMCKGKNIIYMPLATYCQDCDFAAGYPVKRKR